MASLYSADSIAVVQQSITELKISIFVHYVDSNPLQFHLRIIQKLQNNFSGYLSIISYIYKNTNRHIIYNSTILSYGIINTLLYCDFDIVNIDKTVINSMFKYMYGIESNELIKYNQYIVHFINIVFAINTQKANYIVTVILNQYLDKCYNHIYIFENVISKIDIKLDIISISVAYKKLLKHDISSVDQLNTCMEKFNNIDKLVNTYREYLQKENPYQTQKIVRYKLPYIYVLESFVSSVIPLQYNIYKNCINKLKTSNYSTINKWVLDMCSKYITPNNYTHIYRVLRSLNIDYSGVASFKCTNDILSLILISGHIIDKSSYMDFVEYEPTFADCTVNGVDNIPSVVASLRIIFGYVLLSKYAKNKKYYNSIVNTLKNFTSISFIKTCESFLQMPDVSFRLYGKNDIVTQSDVDNLLVLLKKWI